MKKIILSTLTTLLLVSNAQAVELICNQKQSSCMTLDGSNVSKSVRKALKSDGVTLNVKTMTNKEYKQLKKQLAKTKKVNKLLERKALIEEQLEELE